MNTWQKLALGAAAVVLAASVLGDDEPGPTPAATAVTSSEPSAPPVPAERPSASPTAASDAQPSPPAPAASSSPAAATSALLQAASGGDGDSWRDTSGRQYRLGLINTPERGECYSAEATAERRALTAAGFRAQVYATDRYDRRVSVVTSADGVNVNVHLARNGFADDRFLAQFRDENPGLAAELERAFAAARSEGRGLWSACPAVQDGQAAAGDAPPADAPAAVAAPAPAGSDCHPDYTTCIPVKGDGSGRGQANDLDCGDLDRRVQLRQAGVDPYRLDADGDGVGCNAA